MKETNKSPEIDPEETEIFLFEMNYLTMHSE